MGAMKSNKKIIVRRLELVAGLSDEKINKIEKQLITWGIHLDSKFQGEDNYFIVGFKDEMDLLAFELANGTITMEEGWDNDNRWASKK